jgi:hypothetical protein
MQHHTRIRGDRLPLAYLRCFSPDRQFVVLFYRRPVPPHLDGSLGYAHPDVDALKKARNSASSRSIFSGDSFMVRFMLCSASHCARIM